MLAQIGTMISYANTAYANSGVDLNLVLAGTRALDSDEISSLYDNGYGLIYMPGHGGIGTQGHHILNNHQQYLNHRQMLF